MKDKVSCPFTYAQLTEDHRDWCKKIAGAHCRDKPCQWRSDPVDTGKKVAQCPICHPRLF